MTPEQVKKLTEVFKGFKLKGGSPVVPNDKESVNEFLFRVQKFGEFSAGNKATNIKVEVDKGTYFEIVSPASGTVTVSVKDLVGSAYAQQGVQGVQQGWFTSEADAYEAAATAMGTFSDPKNLTDAGRRAVREKFNIYAQQGRFTFESRAATSTGPYTTNIVGSGETRTLILSQDGKRVASSHLGAALTDYTEDELNVVRQNIEGSDERFVMVQARGKTIAQWRESTLDENKIGHTSFKAAWEKAGEEGIPEDRRDVKTSIAPDGSTRYFPAIKPAGAPEADIGTTETADTTTIKLGEGQGSLLIYKTGNQVGSIRIPPTPGKTIQNTFKTPGGGVRAIFSDGSEEVYGEADFTLGTPTKRMGPGGQEDWYIEHAPGQYTQVPKTFEPTVVRIGDREFVQDTKGDLAPLPREFDPGLTQIGGRTIMQQPKGTISELDRLFDPGIITREGVQGKYDLIQQPKGEVSQTRAANINEIIAQALIDGNFDKALAFQDFANRPSAKEAFDAALSFARSPADQQLVSSIARGETPVAPPPPGVVQRIGPQPDFLVQAYNEFQQRLRGGRPPTPEEQEQYSARYRAGETPVSGELRLKIKTQEDANARAMEKNEQAMAALEQKRETDQRNFDLKFQQQQQDYDLKIAQATGQFQKVGKERTATGQKTVDDAYAATADDTVTTANAPVSPGTEKYYKDGNWYVREIEDKPGQKTLTAQEQIDKNKADKEAGFAQQFKDLNEELSAGIGPNGTGRFAGLVTSDQIQQWVSTAFSNAGTSTRFNEVMFEALSSLAEPVHEQNVEEVARQKDVIARQVDPLAYATKAAAKDKRLAGVDLTKAADIERALEQDDDGPPAGVTEVATEVPDVVETVAPDAGTGPGGGGGGGWSASSGVGSSTPSDWDPMEFYAKGGMTSGKRLEIVGEEGPELVDLPPGTFVLPLKNLNQRELRQAQKKGIPGYQSGGIVFQDLPLGLRQQQAGRAITPPRGYLSRAAGLTLPSAQAFQNITPESREVFFDVAKQAGIPQGAFAQELRTAFPGGQRLPVSRNYPLRFRGVR